MNTGGQEKVRRERKFHNEWARSLDLDELLVKESFESPTAIENRYALEQLGNLRGKKLLDMGCGAGETSVYFALRGAQVTACDIAEEFLGVGRRLADKYRVKIDFNVADAGSMPYADDSFDIVYGNGVLHHVDLESASKEIYRILKPGGQAAFIEPLPYNPVINVYRKMAAAVRTEDEKPLTYKQIREFSARFSSSRKKEFWLVSLYMFIHFFLVKRWHPAKVRYWKRIIEVGENYRGLFSKLQTMDRFLLRYLPFLRPLCWNTVITVKK